MLKSKKTSYFTDTKLIKNVSRKSCLQRVYSIKFSLKLSAFGFSPHYEIYRMK